MASTRIIAEAGINHDGNFEKAKKLVDVAIEAKADYVKFQSFDSNKLVCNEDETSTYIDEGKKADETFRDLLEKLQLDISEIKSLRDYCESSNIGFISTPFDEDNLKLLIDLGVDFIKVASGDLTNTLLLREISKYDKPVVLSTGMGTLGDIEIALDCLNNTEVTLLHCISWYPAEIETANLRYIRTLQNAFDLPVGYSDHTLGNEASCAAVALVAEVLEKHFTINTLDFGPDHKASLSPNQLIDYIKAIRKVELALGDSSKRTYCNKEIDQRRVHRRSIVASRDLNKGEIVSSKDLCLKRPGTGISPHLLDLIIGSKIKKDIKYNTLLKITDLSFDD